MRCKSIGPTNARIAVVGEAPTKADETAGALNQGSAGYELQKMLRDAKINISECFHTCLCLDRPIGDDIKLWIGPKKQDCDGTEVLFRGKKVKPHIVEEWKRLCAELAAVGPNVVIASGNFALWALTPYDSVSKWRGSILESDAIPGLKVIPCYTPTQVLRMYEWRFITVQDYRRVAKESFFPEIKKPQYNFITNPSFQIVCDTIYELLIKASIAPLTLVSDVEIKRNEVLCVGIAWSSLDAICIPFYGPSVNNGPEDKHYWTPEEHVIVVELIKLLFTHSSVRLCNQNISFDIQYFFWRLNFWPRAYFDTMIAQNVLFPGLTKSLDFLASLYNDYYIYWKDDGKFWDKPVIYPQLWAYNCIDCVATYEVMEKQQQALTDLHLVEQMAFQMRLFHPVMRMMLRGVKVNVEQKKQIMGEVDEFLTATHKEVTFIAGRELVGPSGGFSPQKLQKFFYTDMGFKPIKNRVKGKVTITCDDEALKKLQKIDPIVRPLTERINMIRSYKTAADAVGKKVDKDGRWRTSYNLAGTTTYRFSSSENPFGSGLNLQNLTVGKDII